MNEKSWLRVLNSCSDNRKSKIENLKWAGLLAIVVTLALGGAVAEPQQQPKIAKIGELSGRAALTPRNELLPRALSGLDYVDGKDRILKTGSAEGKLDPLRALIVSLNAPSSLSTLLTAME